MRHLLNTGNEAHLLCSLRSFVVNSSFFLNPNLTLTLNLNLNPLSASGLLS